MNSRTRWSGVYYHALLALSLLVLPSVVASQGGDGKEHHETHQNQDGTWTQTDTHGDGSKTETHMDKERHKDKETEYDKNGNVLVERKWEWNAKSKEEIKRKEIHHAHDKYLRSEKEFDENGVPVQETVWFDGYMLVDTYKYGKRIKREKLVDGKVVKTERFDSDGKRIVGMLSGAPAPPVFSAGATLNGVVAAVPDQFAPGEVLAFRVVMLTGEVVANEAMQLTNSMGGSMWTTTDQQGGVEVTIPPRWKDVGVDVLGISTVIYAAAHVAASAPMLTQVPALLQPGSLFTLHGDGFRPSMTGNVVSVGDATATVMGATPNALTVFAPATLKTGATPIRVTTNGKSTAVMTSNTIQLAFDPGPTTLVAGQRVTRTLRVTGSVDQLPIQITDTPGDAATLSSTGPYTTSGGANNTLNVTLTATRKGTYSLGGDLDWRTFDLQSAPVSTTQPSDNDMSNEDHRAADAHRAHIADREALYNWVFGQGDNGKRERAASRKWHEASEKWRAAANAWDNNDPAAAKAFEADAEKAERAARDALAGKR